MNVMDEASDQALINALAASLGVDPRAVIVAPDRYTVVDAQLPYLLKAWDYLVERQVISLCHDPRETT